MELKEFVKETLTNIITGIYDSQKFMEDNNYDGEICPKISSDWEKTGYVFSEGGKPIQNIDFDVAVTISEKKDTKGKIGIIVSSIGLGAEKNKEKSNGQNSRIKFSIPITYPSIK